MYHLAEHLGQPLQTVLDMTVEEYNHWFAYLKIKALREKNNGKYRPVHRNIRKQHSRVR